MKDRTPGERPAIPDFTPVPRKCNRHDGWTPERQRAFIEALADTGSVRHAARTVNMASEGAYSLRRQPGAEEFAAAWNVALDHGVRRLEDIALERAIYGSEAPVYSYGKLVGTRTVYNDRLIMFMLRNRAADRFSAGASGKRLNQRSEEEIINEFMQANAEESRNEIMRRIDEIRKRIAAAREAGDLVMVRADEFAKFEEWKKMREETASEE